MNKKLFVLIFLAVAVFFAAGFYYLNNSGNQQISPKLVTDDFDMNIPEGWTQSSPAQGVSAMVVNSGEKIDNAAAKEISFKSYFAVSRDVSEEGLPGYLETIKNSLAQVIPGIVFEGERDGKINGRDAKIIEAKMTQKGVDFRALVVLVKGDGEDVWTISFSTIEEKWEEYKGIFNSVAESFKLKIK